MLVEIARRLSRSGLTLRGGFHPTRSDRSQSSPLGNAATILLVGNTGGAFWPAFERWRLLHANIANPLDTWSRQVIGHIADRFGARAVSPSDRPFLPFQQWAMRAEGLRPSPLGILMHPEFGVWHAYRGALLFDEKLDLLPARKAIHLCDLCNGKPCKKACPVNAHQTETFAYADCLEHLHDNPGGACMTGGCQDRNACPYGVKYRYPAPLQAFIAEAFVR